MLTVWHWTPDTVEEWISEVRPGMRHSVNRAHWPSEREPRVGVQLLDSRFAAYRDAVGLDPALEFHWLRRSYITHLIEDGHDPLFVQQQVGHDHASTTAIYTCVSSDFRTRSLPKSCLIWLRNPNVVRLLRGLTTGTIPLSHKGPHQETPWRTVTHLRDLLMNSSVLPRVDRQILLCQRWLTERLATIEDPEHRLLPRHFATRHQMRRLRAAAEKGCWDALRRTRPSRKPPGPAPSLPGSPTEAARASIVGRPATTPGTPRSSPPGILHRRSSAGA
ncbi:tyrosine-type recombinase/integrase [Streptomyces sp. NPDC056178]|uniref:tyrosine-type recombinase/integrase n=1 Tax=Streptomyces sp. NPDC056178 TaxID=3345735 RepID=UPI0035DD586A